jgi:hypothetical protein
VRPSPCGSYGDLDGDGYVTSSDAHLVTLYLLGKELSREQLAVADVDGDGRVTSKDATLILDYATGAIDTFPVCQLQPPPPPPPPARGLLSALWLPLAAVGVLVAAAVIRRKQ